MYVIWVDSVVTLGLKMAPSTRSSRCPTAQSCTLKGSTLKGSVLSNKIIVENDILLKKSSDARISGKVREKPSLISKGRVPKKKEKGGEQEELVSDMEDVCQLQRSLCSPSFSEIEAMEIRNSLLDWYDRNHRVLPWRINTHSLLNPVIESVKVKKEVFLQGAMRKKSAQSPLDGSGVSQGERAYAVWVSEMMLQQTRVATVIRYYQRWMETWPTVHALAQASQEEVNAVWAGLGYYRRARFLLEGAKQIVQNLGGEFPQTVSELQRVPGIGRYTAGAVASIAFKEAVPVVDGNVIRVLCRLQAISMNPKASTAVKLFWSLATELVHPHRPGDFNQALMELGATICTSTTPSCSSCPIASHCKALKLVSRLEDNITSVTCFPAKALKAEPREEYVTVCLLESGFKLSGSADSSFLLVQRPTHGLLAGLWEFPSAPLDNAKSTLKSRRSAMDQYLEKSLAIKLCKGRNLVVKREEIGTYVHVFSHIRLNMFIEWMLLQPCEETVGAHIAKEQCGVVTKWVEGTSISNLGLTSGVRKVHKMFREFQELKLVPPEVSKRRKKTRMG